MLTMREFQITGKILGAGGALHIKDLADEFGVSTRTIQYDLDGVKNFFDQQGIPFYSGSRRGIWIECTDAVRDAAALQLSQMQAGRLYFDQDTRARKILLELIFVGDYVTIGRLADTLGVSRGTVLSDLEQVSALLSSSELVLDRRPRQGIRLVGVELNIRTLGETLFQEALSVYEVYRTTNQLRNPDQQTFVPAVAEPLREVYLLVMRQLAAALVAEPERMQRENLILMIARLLISLARVRQSLFIGTTEPAGKQDRYYLVPVWSQIYAEAGLPVLHNELDYVQGIYREIQLPVDIAALTSDLIETISRQEDFPYAEDSTLYSRLLMHLRLSFSSEGSNTSNPFNDLILKNHAPLFESIKAVCAKHMASTLLLSNESFISYLALHFLVAKRNLGVGRRMRVVFVCATGHGAAKIIERMLEAQVHRIDVVCHCSLMEVERTIEHYHPDFIVSVFPIEAPVPVVQVEPLPTKANIANIEAMIEKLADVDELLYMPQTVDFLPQTRKPEDVSQDVILLGLKLYGTLKEIAGLHVLADMEFAFLAHVMLLANRYQYDNQYPGGEAMLSQQEEDIDKLLRTEDVKLSSGELKALSYFLEPDMPAQGREE